jgi:SAM-dependent methyltransferase
MQLKQRGGTADKYAPQAERWSAEAYADSDAYLAHRADLIVLLGPTLAPGETVLDLACGDGGLARFLQDYRYRGVDASPDMVEAGRRQGREVILGDLNDYVPAEPVAATTCFRAIYYASDRAAFFRHVGDYTRRKLVFDLNPRQYRVADIRRELRAAGFSGFELRPFLAPQRVALPGVARAGLQALERSGPLARLLLRFRFSYLCAAFRGGKNS